MSQKHGRDKEPERDDPFELNGINAPGNKDFMARTLIEEYARLGYGKDRLMAIFKNEFYQSAHNVYQELGEEAIESIVDEVLEPRDGYSVEIEYTHENMDAPPSPFAGNGEVQTDE